MKLLVKGWGHFSPSVPFLLEPPLAPCIESFFFSFFLFIPPLQCKIWLKPSSEQSFLYGNHVMKSGLGRITESTGQYQGVVLYSMNDTPLVSINPTYFILRT